MDAKKKKTCLGITAAAFVMLIAAFVTDRIPSTRLKGEAGGFLVHNAWVPLVLSAVALVCALIYILKDGKKQAAPFHKGMTGAFLLMYIHFFHMTLVTVHEVPADMRVAVHLLILILLVGYSAFLLLCFAKNQGKKTSLTLAVIAAVADMAVLFFFIVEAFSPAVLFSCIAKLLTILLFYLLMEAKYHDKDARGTV